MEVTLKYNSAKYRHQQEQMYVQNIDQYADSLEKILNSSNDVEWINSVRNVNARLAVLKESYKLIAAFRRKRPKGEELKLPELSEDEEGSSTETGENSGKRSTQ